ncbi:MAG: flagellar motor protein MotB [Planctomycetes bacterium]|nr:flagellar motor protein MotB [Planctomycetota bacterium]
MARKQKAPPAGAPAWLLTYGDMITLVLCFFVLLFSMSEIKKDKISKTMRAFQQQFGILPKYKSMVQVFVETRRLTQTEANVLRKGPPGKTPNVQVIDPGLKMKRVIGGKEYFNEWDHNLTIKGKQLIASKIAPELRGYDNRIEIRGHTASASYGGGSPYRDAWDLSYRRALAVMQYLVEECGLSEERFRLVACGDNDPIMSNLLPDAREYNRRVEIVMTEELVSDRELRKQP